MLKQQPLRDGSQAGGSRRVGNRDRFAQSVHHFRKKLAKRRSNAAVAATQPGVRLRVAQGKQLELHGNQNQAAVSGQLGVVSSQRRQFFSGIRVAAESGGERLDSLTHPFLENREENVFLALEVGIKGAAGIS